MEVGNVKVMSRHIVASRAAISIASWIFTFFLITFVPMIAASAHSSPSVNSDRAATGSIEVTPIPTDPTVTVLNKEKLAQEVQQLKNQNEPDFFGWLRMNASILLSTLVVVIGGLIGLWRWLGDRRSEREKRAEERFQKAVEGLGDEKERAKVGAAIILRTFLQPGYEQFYQQAFDLAVANLRFLDLPPRLDQPPGSLSQVLTTVFKESFPLARNRLKKQSHWFDPKSLNASGIQLDKAYLYGADLQEAWMPEASLQEADLKDAKLNPIKLEKAKLTGAELNAATLSGADLTGATLTRAILTRAVLPNVSLEGATLRNTTLICADLTEAILTEAILIRADLTEAFLTKADLTKANLSETNPEDATSLTGTIMHDVIGLSKEQRKACKDKGAIIEYSDQQSEASSTTNPN